MGIDSPTLGGLLAHIAEGRMPDWTALEKGNNDVTSRETLENLRVIAGIADFHRGLQERAPAEPPPALAAPSATALSVDLFPSESLSETPTRDVPVSPALVPPRYWGRFRILSELGRGSFGQVFEALDTQLDREVALKLLWADCSSPDLVERLLVEARMMARVDHDNVAAVYGAEEHDGRAGLFMELVRGTTLEDLIQAQGPLGSCEAALIGRELCGALVAVHAAGLVHQDVKASNVMREEGGRVVLMDFGAGRLHGCEDGRGIAGTPLYVAPEVLRGATPDNRSDVYSLGVLLFRLVTRSYPVKGRGLEGLREAHDRGERRSLRDERPDLPEAFVRVVERALQPSPPDRYPSVGTMQEALAAALGAFVEPVPVVYPVPRPRVRQALAALLVAVVAVAAAAQLSGGGGGGSAPPALVRALVVLPFEFPPEDDQAKLGSQLGEDVARDLQLRGVRVIAGDSARQAVELSGADMAAGLGADAVLRVVVRPEGDRLRATVRLASTGTDTVLWTREYEQSPATLGALPERVAEELAQAVGAAPAARRHHTPSIPALTAYTKGRLYAQERTPASLELAIQHFDEALRLDPRYAAALAGKSDAYLALGVPTFGALRPREARSLATQAALQALELDPDLAEAQTSLAFIAFFHDWDWKAAEGRFLRAIALDPYYPGAHHWYANYLNAMGRQDDAMREIQTALKYDPLSILLQRDVAWHLFHQRKYGDAVQQLRKVLALKPDYTAARTLLGRALVENGQAAPGLEELRRAAPAMPGGSGQAFVAYALAATGDVAGADKALRLLTARTSKEYVAPYYVALVYARLGQRGPALDWLERAFAEQDPTLVSLRIDPRWDPLRGTPRYEALVRRMNFPSSQTDRGV